MGVKVEGFFLGMWVVGCVRGVFVERAIVYVIELLVIFENILFEVVVSLFINYLIVIIVFIYWGKV